MLKHSSIILAIALCGVRAVGQQYEPAHCAGYEVGALVFISKQNAPDMFGLYQSATWAYFGDLRSGIRTGIDYSASLEGANRTFIVPIHYAHRGLPRTENRESIGLFDWLLLLIPTRLEVNVGPSIGYIEKSPVTTPNGEFRARRELLLSVNAGLRPSAQVWRFNLGVNLCVGYVPTKNFIYQSSNLYENGLTTGWMLHVGGYLTYAFDI